MSDPEHIKNNSVGRVHRVLTRALHHPVPNNRILTAEVWADIFNVIESEPPLRYTAVAEHLGNLIHQLYRGEKMLAAEGANPSTYATQFTSAREILSPLALNSPWGTHHQKINSEIVTTLALCADRLREDSSSLPAEEFAEALATLDQLEEQVQQGDFDEALKIFVTAEIEILRAGIRDYPTLGLAAIVDTLEKAVGKMMLARASGQIEMRAKPVSKILQMLSTFDRWIIVHAPQMKMLSEAVKKLLDDGS